MRSWRGKAYAQGTRSLLAGRQRFLFRWLVAAVNARGTMLLQKAPLALAWQGIDLPALRRHWVAGNPKGNDQDLVRLTFLALNIALLERDHVQGAFAELGVWRGNSAKVIHALAPSRRFYLFDTFGGFAGSDLGECPQIASHFRDTSAEQVRSFLGPAANLRIVAGRFPDTAIAVPPDERFAFAHIDCDLYAPIRAALEFFYPRMTARGLIVVHDYASGCWPGVARAVDEFLADKPDSPLLAPDTSGSLGFRRIGLRR